MGLVAGDVVRAGRGDHLYPAAANGRLRRRHTEVRCGQAGGQVRRGTDGANAQQGAACAHAAQVRGAAGAERLFADQIGHEVGGVGVRAGAEHALDRGADVGRGQRRSRRRSEAEAAAEPERPGAAVIGDHRERGGQFGGQARAGGAGAVGIVQQLGAGGVVELPGELVLRDIQRRVRRADIAGRDDAHDARDGAARSDRGAQGDPQAPLGDSQGLRTLPDRDAPHDAVAGGVDADHRPVAAVGHPDSVRAHRQRARRRAHGDRCDDGVGARIDAHQPVLGRDGHPDRAGSHRDGVRTGPDPQDRQDRERLGVDAHERAGDGVRDPHGAGADRDATRLLTDADPRRDAPAARIDASDAAIGARHPQCAGAGSERAGAGSRLVGGVGRLADPHAAAQGAEGRIQPLEGRMRAIGDPQTASRKRETAIRLAGRDVPGRSTRAEVDGPHLTRRCGPHSSSVREQGIGSARQRDVVHDPPAPGVDDRDRIGEQRLRRTLAVAAEQRPHRRRGG